MYLISSGKSTILSEFKDLNTVSTYKHENSESTDFQFTAHQRMFVEVNKKSGLEVLRIKEKTNEPLQIQRVRKLNIESVFCVACAKQSCDEMALGLSNGQVRLYGFADNSLLHRFNAESIRNSVLYMDYNASDEYLAAVFENGQINIFGTKTKARVDKFNMDENSTLVRFHPTKRFHLSIASHKGSVYIYDVQSRRKLFHYRDAHKAPCRDLSLSAAKPDVLVSVGYDCIVNIYDTRRKTQPIQLKHDTPLSTVCFSQCGNYLGVGSLKGELLAYDMRSMNSVLCHKKIHDAAVTRMAFVPSIARGENVVPGISLNDVDVSSHTTNSVAGEEPINANRARVANDDTQNELPPTARVAAVRTARDSFCDLLDFQANKTSDRSERFVMRRDSLECWEDLQRKYSIAESRPSPSAGLNTGISAIMNNNSLCDSFENKLKSNATNSPAGATPFVAPLRERSSNVFIPNFTSKLVQIEEEQHSLAHDVSLGSDKENAPSAVAADGRLELLPGDRNSTPNKDAAAAKAVPVVINSGVDEIRQEMRERFQQLQSFLNFELDSQTHQIFTATFRLWNELNEKVNVISDAMGVLLQTDPFVAEFRRMQQENRMLKEKLQQGNLNQGI